MTPGINSPHNTITKGSKAPQSPRWWLPVLLMLMFLLPRALSGSNHESLLFRQLSTADGLSQNTVRTLLVDRKGFLWAGTLDGLNRFDGNRFIVHKPQLGLHIPMSDHRIREVIEDKEGFIWVRKYDNSFSCYNPLTESFIELTHQGRVVSLPFTNFVETSGGYTWLWEGATGAAKIHYRDGLPGVALLAGPSSGLLTNHRVQFIFEDSAANTWIGTANGLNLYIGNGTFNGFFKNETGSNTFVRALEINRIVYFITTGGYIYRYCLERGEFLSHLSLGNNFRVTDGANPGNDEILLLTIDHGVIKYNISTREFNINPFPGNTPLTGQAGLIIDSRGGIWIFDHSGILRHYLQEKDELRELHLIPRGIVSVIDYERYVIFIDSRGEYWITTYGNGLFRYNPVTGSLQNFRYSPRYNSPSSNFLLSVTEDRAGNIWVGSEYSGIIQVIRQNFAVRWFQPNRDGILGSGNNAKAVLEDSRGNVWVGLKNGGLYIYDKKMANPRKIPGVLNPYTIIEDHEQQVWIGTKGHGVFVYDLNGLNLLRQFRHDPANPYSLSHNSVFYILQDNKERIWVATFGGGLNLLNQQGNEIRFTRFFYDEGNKSFIRHLLQDSEGNIWTGSYDGLIGFNPDDLIKDSSSYRHHTFNPGNTEGLNCNDIKTIHQDKQGTLWIGTAGGGLNKMVRGDGQEGRFIKFTDRQGLPSNVVNDILECNDSVLWVSTENGISRFNHTYHTFRTYRFAEHPRGNFFNENAGIKRANGEILIGTLDGLIAFHPGNFIDNMHVPPVVLTDLYLYDERVQTGNPGSPLANSISATRILELDYGQNTFTLHFASLNLTEPNLNKYSYMMEPYDKSWSMPTSSSMATYKNLPPGRYTFKVKGANADGFWSQQVTELEIIVAPPFWRSNMAIAIYIMIITVLLLLTFLVIFKISRLNNAVRLEKELTDYKLQFFTNISHEFRTPLTLIRGAVEILSGDKTLTESGQRQVALLNRNSRQMTRLIDQLLEFRKIQSNKLTLNLELTNLTRFLQNIHATFKENAISKNINFTLSTNLENPEGYIDQDKIEKILFNLLSNAFKFTAPGGSIELLAGSGEAPGKMQISVTDNGTGIPKEKQHLLFSRFMQVNFSSGGTGVGLSLVKEFAGAHQGKVWFEPNIPRGAIFRLEIPVDSSLYKEANIITTTPEPYLVINNNGEHAPADEEFAGPDKPTSNNWKILVIDDNKEIRDFLSNELGDRFQVQTAENGETGLEMAFANNPDLIVCDVKMPNMDGLEVTSRLKNDFHTSHIPVIILTALSSEATRIKSSESGADAYIMKPFSLKYLVSRIQNLIDQREKLKKRFSIEVGLTENLLSNTSKDKEFYQLVNKVLDNNISNPDFSVEDFTRLCNQKRTIFYKKIKGLTGYSPNDLVKIKRMKRAAELLLAGKHTVAEVSWMVGIEDQFYFSKCFKSQFGCTPSKYSRSIQEKLLDAQ